MGKVTCGIAMSLDGFVAGPNQRLDKPFGDIDEDVLHGWMFGPEADKHKAEREYNVDAGAFIMGLNMFVPKEKRDDPEWKGWWGDNPPFHAPVFVLCKEPRESIAMEGGTVFHFVTGGTSEALQRATEAAEGKDVEIGGGVSTVRQYLEAGLIDELNVAIAPMLLGSGEHLLYGLDLTALGYECTTHVPTAAATHVMLTKRQ